MKSFDTRTYSVADILEWHKNDLLELSPDFQRRSVWSPGAKSYLIDTIVRGKPIPKILLQLKLEKPRQHRIIVDGQQRLRSILEYINGDFKLSKAHNEELAGHTYEMLPQDKKDDFLKYELGCDVLYDMAYEDILDIFARINTYTVSLNTQEKRNANYIGYFKQHVYRYGYKYVKYFLEGSIITKREVTRMAEAELTAELFVALIGGVQTNKNTEQYYIDYDEKEGKLPEVDNKFDEIMSYIGEIYPPNEISLTNWSRVHLFYSLFTSIAHLLYGLKELDDKYRTKITKKMVGKLRVLLDEISSKYDMYAQDDTLPVSKDFKEFFDYSRRRTTDTAARVARANFICKTLTSKL